MQFAEIIISFTSLLVAICALFFTWYQARLSREHNKLSVKPHITTFAHSRKAGTDALLTMEIMNNGLGPAIIKNFNVLFDGKSISKNDPDATEKHIQEHFQTNDYHIEQMGFDYAMPANEVRTLLALKFPNSVGLVDDYKKMLDRYDLVIEYQNMYGDRMPAFKTSNKPPKASDLFKYESE